MRTPFEARGVWPAMATPFTSESELALDAFRRLVRFVVDQGVTGVVPCGTTGESPTLTWSEHEALVSCAIDEVDGRVGVMAGAGSNNTREAIAGTRDAKERGASAALLVDCYYNGPSSQELRDAYYRRIRDAVPDLPLVPYVVPGRTGCALSPEDVALLHLESPERVPAVKEATADLARMRVERDLAGDGLAILSGDDHLALATILDPAVRAAGVISVMANLVPAAMVSMVEAAREGDRVEAETIGKRIEPLLAMVGVSAASERQLPNGRRVRVHDRYRNPRPLKTMMAGLGMLESTCRPPLGAMSELAVEMCRAAVRDVWERAPEVLRPIEDAFDVRIEARLADRSVWR